MELFMLCWLSRRLFTLRAAPHILHCKCFLPPVLKDHEARTGSVRGVNRWCSNPTRILKQKWILYGILCKMASTFCGSSTPSIRQSLMGLTSHSTVTKTQSCWICPEDLYGRSPHALFKYTGSLLPLTSLGRVFRQWHKTYEQVHTIDFRQCVRVSSPAIFLFGRLHIHVTVETHSGLFGILPQFPKNHRRQWQILATRQLWEKKSAEENQTFEHLQMSYKKAWNSQYCKNFYILDWLI